MPKDVIKDWTERLIVLTLGAKERVKFQVYNDGPKQFQKICSSDSVTIKTLELPSNGMLDKNSYEVLLHYALRRRGKP